jgi:mannitol/fructose-specific phosphotransferase system IIA component (Ntr-type)
LLKIEQDAEGQMMPLSDIFGREHIKLDLESTTRDEVFEELIETIIDPHLEYDRQEMLNAVIFRENQMTTAILPGIAVPHGYCNAVNGIAGAIGVSRAGIEYGDSGPVYSIFMLLMDKSSRERHLRILSRLLDLLNSESFAVIRTAKSSQEVYDILNRF